MEQTSKEGGQNFDFLHPDRLWEEKISSSDTHTKYSYDGPLFRGRYKALLVEDDAYFLQNSRYIHLNPVKAGIVSAPEFYPYSSYTSLIGMNHQRIVDEERTLRYFKAPSSQRYRTFVEQGMGCQSFEEKIRKEVGEDELWLPW